MNARLTVVIALLIGLIAVVALDVHDRSAAEAAMAERNEVARRLDGLAREERSRATQIEAAHTRRAALRAAADTKAALPNRDKTTNAAIADGQFPVVVSNDDLRRLRMRTFVAEQRLKFDAILRQLRLTPAQLAKFDEIEAQFQESVLDAAGPSKARGAADRGDVAVSRQEVAAMHDARLRELFGDNYDAWQEARRTQGVRATADELLGQAFQGSAVIEASQAQALVGLLERHGRSSAGRYDWERVAADAAGIFTGAQLDALRTALALRTLTEKMNAVSGGRR